MTSMYQKTHEETSARNFPTWIPTSVVGISECKVNKLQDGPLPPTPQGQYTVVLGIPHHMGRDLDVGGYRLRDDPTFDRTRDCVRATQYGGRTIEHAT